MAYWSILVLQSCSLSKCCYWKIGVVQWVWSLRPVVKWVYSLECCPFDVKWVWMKCCLLDVRWLSMKCYAFDVKWLWIKCCLASCKMSTLFDAKFQQARQHFSKTILHQTTNALSHSHFTSKFQQGTRTSSKMVTCIIFSSYMDGL